MNSLMNIEEGKLAFLKNLTKDVVDASRVFPEQELSGIAGISVKKNTTGITLIRPGGRICYPAFWIRDLAMDLESGLITADELKGVLLLTAQCQRGAEPWHLDTEAVVPPFAIPDHILLNGEPVFFPGTYSFGPDQGGVQFGYQPPFDDNYYFIEMAYYYLQMTEDESLFQIKVKGIPLLERLHKAFTVPPYDKTTGIVQTTQEDRGVNFGFFDSIYQTGYLLFASLLRFRAALCMKTICESLGEINKAKQYQEEADKIKKFIPSIFATSSGWLNATTGICKQHDVWGTAYAIYIDVLEGNIRKKALSAIRQAYRSRTICYRGNVRQILTTENYSKTSAWEKALSPINRYQNGAYWGTASGWVFYALYQADKESFSKMVNEYINELTEGDYRKGEEYGSPWECFHPDGNWRQNSVYKTSVTLPFAALKRVGLYR
ncbi:hypothetical protein ES705_35863 [subsurface metagenome]